MFRNLVSAINTGLICTESDLPSSGQSTRAVSKLETAEAEKIFPGANSTLCSAGEVAKDLNYSSQKSSQQRPLGRMPGEWLAGAADPGSSQP